MGGYCENCGAKLDRHDKFCPDCGTKVTNMTTHITNNSKYCPNCGNIIEHDNDFCQDCGTKLVSQKAPKKMSFIEENKAPLIIISVAAIVVLVFLCSIAITSNNTHSSDMDYGEQTVSVGGVSFTIPANYYLIPSSIDYTTEGYVSSYSHTYTNGDENISIGVMKSFSIYDVDENQVVKELGGTPKTMYGYDGYYIQDTSFYSFNFAMGDQICIISTTSPYIFDEIKIN